jgi:hypothetical protein
MTTEINLFACNSQQKAYLYPTVRQEWLITSKTLRQSVMRRLKIPFPFLLVYKVGFSYLAF